jgi:transposase
MSSEERIAELEALVTQLRDQNEQLAARIHELEEQLAHAKRDSHTSSKPPSSDGLRRKTMSLREPSGKRAGGQLGNRGETLHLVATPDTVMEHHPAVCTCCQSPLDGEPALRRERCQIQEVPSLRLVVTEHQAVHVRCPICAQVSVGRWPAEVPSRAQYGPLVRALAVYLLEEQLVPSPTRADLRP